MNVLPVRLAGETVALEPLAREHAPALFRHVDLDDFRHTLDRPADASFAAFEAWVLRALALPDSLVFATLLQPTGEPIGVTGYLEIRPAHRGLEIGRTWIPRPWQGTRVNPESKLLLLRHAFEALGALRVQWKTDLLNLHSQRAVEKLGARREGVLRQYQTRSDGSQRDSVLYSVTREEWPEVRAGLEARLRRL
jgi:RimJ/RimL family protein N-acetyltransferase